MSQISQRSEPEVAGTPLQRWGTRMKMQHGRKLVIALPYLWLILLFMLPFLIVLKIGFADIARAIPPYTDLVTGRTTSSTGAQSGQLPDANRRSAVRRSLSHLAEGGGDLNSDLSADRLSAGVGGGAQQALHAHHPAAAGDPAVVDLVRCASMRGWDC